MILVDSSVWIDYFRGTANPQTDTLDALLGTQEVATSDLVMAEVLQGFTAQSDFEQARKLMSALAYLELGGQEVAIQAARNFRMLRALGVTVRKTIDTLIATQCIESDLPLLYTDRDFDPFVRHLGLRSAIQSNQTFNP